ncbi:MAG: DUF3611 family protein [Nostocales cyanobacterium W4_Combined_metabat2_030]|nr:DUF3611 family protein [Nostocales cyanobacterium W4_Combined_metabat2_030]
MSNKPDLPALPPSVQRVIPLFRYGGWVSFWVQLVLAVVAALIFLFAGFSTGSRPTTGAGAATNPGTGPGIFFAVCGLVMLGISIYWAFTYTRLALQLQSANPNLRPKPSYANKVLRRGLMLNLTGMGLSLMGAEAITGTLLGKSFQSQGVGFVVNGTSAMNTLIQPLDIFVVIGNTHTTLAHFCGIVTALWLLNWVNKD